MGHAYMMFEPLLQLWGALALVSVPFLVFIFVQEHFYQKKMGWK
jgi:hypothetical protein